MLSLVYTNINSDNSKHFTNVGGFSEQGLSEFPCSPPTPKNSDNMITIKITQSEIEELQNDQRVRVKNPDGIVEIYLSIITRMPLSFADMTPGEVNIRLGITYGDSVMLEDTGLYKGDGFELKLDNK